MSPEPRCPREVDCVAWLQGELSSSEQRDFSRHMASCPRCRSAATHSADILSGLQPAMAQAPRRTLRRASLVGAAVALLLVALLWPDAPAAPSAAPEHDQAADWLGLRLDADGNWDRASWTCLGAGQDVGVHAFALLALSRGISPGSEAHRIARVSRAARGLLRRLDLDGRFSGTLGRGRFDHPVATLALLEAYHVTDDPDLGEGARRAVRTLLEDEAARAPGPAPQAGYSAWVLASLARAAELDILADDVDVAAARARAARRSPSLSLAQGDLLDQQQFWAVALGPRRQPPRLAEVDLFGASAALLTRR